MHWCMLKFEFRFLKLELSECPEKNAQELVTLITIITLVTVG